MRLFHTRASAISLTLILLLAAWAAQPGWAASSGRAKARRARARRAVPATEASPTSASGDTVNPANVVGADLGSTSAPAASEKTSAAVAKKASVAPSAAVAAPAAFAPASAPASAAPGGDIYAPFVGKTFEHGPASVKKVALTFDDGPSGILTPKVLEILKREKVPATFFMLGESVEKYPDTAKMVADAGFKIGSHSYHHPRLNKMDETSVRTEIEGASGLIANTTGKQPRLFRAPYGLVGKTVAAVCAEGGLVIVGWSVDPQDWNAKSTPDSVLKRVLHQVKGGAIVCIHDIHARTVTALPGIIASLKAQGYQFCNVSDLLAEAAKHKLEVPVGGMSAGGMGGGMGGEIDPAAAKPAAISLKQSSLK